MKNVLALLLSFILLAGCFKPENPNIPRMDFPKKVANLKEFEISAEGLPIDSLALETILFPYPDKKRGILWVPSLIQNGEVYRIEPSKKFILNLFSRKKTFYNHYQRFLEGKIVRETRPLERKAPKTIETIWIEDKSPEMIRTEIFEAVQKIPIFDAKTRHLVILKFKSENDRSIVEEKENPTGEKIKKEIRLHEEQPKEETKVNSEEQTVFKTKQGTKNRKIIFYRFVPPSDTVKFLRRHQ